MHSIVDIMAIVWIVLVVVLFFVFTLIPYFFGSFEEGDPRAERKKKAAAYGLMIVLTMMTLAIVARMIIVGIVYRQAERFVVETVCTRIQEENKLNPVADGIYLFRDKGNEVHFLVEDGKKMSASNYGVNYDTDKRSVEKYEVIKIAYSAKDIDKKYPIVALDSGVYYSIHLSSIDEIQDVNMTWD